MKLIIDDRDIFFDDTKIMGILSLKEKEDRDLDTLFNEVLTMYEYGAEFVEIGIEGYDVSPDDEERLFLPLIERIKEKIDIIIAIYTRNAHTMQSCISHGAHIIIDPNALRGEGTIETIAKLRCPVVLLFDQDAEHDETVDPTSVVSEYLYERIDACLNAGIERRRIIIDPSLGLRASLDTRLKMIGRLASYKSFGLLISLSIPRALPYIDTYMENNMSVAIAEAIFVSKEGAHIIRTKKVRDMALALDTWNAANTSAKPFKISKAIVQRLKMKMHK